MRKRRRRLVDSLLRPRIAPFADVKEKGVSKRFERSNADDWQGEQTGRGGGSQEVMMAAAAAARGGCRLSTLS